MRLGFIDPFFQDSHTQMTQTAARNTTEIIKFALLRPAMYPRKRRRGRSLSDTNLLVRFASAFSFDDKRMTINTTLHKPRHLHGIG